MVKVNFKKIISVVTAIMLVLSFATVCFAQESTRQINIEQVYGNLPRVDTYFYLLDENGQPVKNGDEIQTVTVSCDGKPLEIENFRKAGEDYESIYFLLDISVSMPNKLFKEVKNEILAVYRERKDTDKVVLITFGEEVTTVLDGSQSIYEATEILDNLKNNNTKTRLLDAIDKVISMGDKGRKVAIAITDGDDVYKGGVTENELKENMAKTHLPIFAMGVNEAETEDLDALGEIARASGGFLERVTDKNIGETFDKVFGYIDSCYVVSAMTETNILPKDASELTLKYAEGISDSVSVKFVDHQPDTVAPEIESVTLAEDKITVKFSENVKNAGVSAAYSVERKDGKNIPIASAEYFEKSKSAVLVPAEKITNGSYTVSVSGITDVSAEENAVYEDFVVTAEDLRSDAEIFLEENMLYIGIGIGVILVIIILMAILLHRRKVIKAEEEAAAEAAQNSVRDKYTAKDGVNLELSMTTKQGVTRKITVFITDRITIGRANECDITIEDTQISRKNTAIEYKNGGLYISDLGSTNGTILNGVKVQEELRLCRTDSLLLGNTKIKVNY